MSLNEPEPEPEQLKGPWRATAVADFVQDYLRMTDRPSERGLLRYAEDKKFPATQLRLKAEWVNLGIRGKAGAPKGRRISK